MMLHVGAGVCLKEVFHMNGYPKEILYNHVKKFLS